MRVFCPDFLFVTRSLILLLEPLSLLPKLPETLLLLPEGYLNQIWAARAGSAAA